MAYKAGEGTLRRLPNTNSPEKVGNKRVANANRMGPAIYNYQAILNLLKDICEPGRAVEFCDMHVEFGGANRGIQAVVNHGKMGPLAFPL